MTAADFRRIALSLERVEEYSHPRIGGFSRRRQEICFRGLASRGVRKSDADVGAEGEGGGARDFPAEFLTAGERCDTRMFAWRRPTRMY
jgi:hypothetical protein